MESDKLAHVLALFYLDKTWDVSSLTPSELTDKYFDVFSEIKKNMGERNRSTDSDIDAMML